MSSYSLKPNSQSSKVIYVNSRDADAFIEQNNFGDDLHTNFLYNLTEKLIVSGNQLALISLYSATIPHSFFNVRNGVNDKIPLQIIYIDDDGAVHTQNEVLQLDDGNYDSTQLIRQIKYGNTPQTAGDIGFQTSIYKGWYDITLNAGTYNSGHSLVGTKLGDLVDLDVRYNEVNNCFRFQLDYITHGTRKIKLIEVVFTWATNPTYGFDTTGSTEELANALYGFSGKLDFPYRADQVENPIGGSSFWGVGDSGEGYNTQSLLQSQQVIDLNDNIHGLMLRTNLTSRGTLSSQSSIFSNILARIPITSLDEDGAKQGAVIYFNPSNATHQNLVDLKAIDTLGVRLTDDKDRTIDLNGLDFQIALLIQFVDKMSEITTSPSRQQIQDTIAKNTPQNKDIKIKKSGRKSNK